MTKSRSFLSALALSIVVLGGGCAGGGAGGGPEMSMATSTGPVSQAPAVGDARNRAKIHTELASLYFQNGNMAVALEEVGIALDADSSYAPAYNVRGLVHMHLRENGTAEESFRHALSLAGGDPEINNNYGWFLCQTGRERASIAYFMNAVKNPYFPTPEKAYVNAGVCAAQINDLAAAEGYLQTALRLGRNTASVLYPLAEVQYRRGDYEEARRLLGDLHRSGEATAQSLWLAVRTERRLGDRTAEASYTAQLRRRFPDSKESQDMKRGIYE